MKIIFLTGHRKSGTSVFHKMFEGHSELNSFPVDLTVFYAYFPCFVAKEADSSARVARIRLILTKVLASLEGETPVGGTRKFVLASFWGKLMPHLDDTALSRRLPLLTAILTAFGTTCGMDLGKAWVVKETSQSVFQDEFLSDTVDMRFVSLVRDPRDNYAALKAGVEGYYSKFGEDEKKTLASLINRARMDMIVAQTKQKAFASTFTAMRFEDITGNTRQSMETVSEFCGIGFETSLLEPTFLGKAYDGNSHEARKFTGLSSENVGNWRDRISTEEAMVIEFWMADVMAAFGYDLAFDKLQAAKAFAEFYEWYNCHYFFHDPFKH